MTTMATTFGLTFHIYLRDTYAFELFICITIDFFYFSGQQIKVVLI